jgi:alpha-beta hydrolase superfamily lysophospholipase
MSHDENYEEEDEEHMHCHMGGPMKKQFKLAMLEKKEAILKAKLEFIGKMKELIKKMPEDKK